MNNKIKQFMMLILLTNMLHPSIAASANRLESDIVAANEFSGGTFFLRPGGSNDYAVLVTPFNANVAAPILSPSWQPEGINPDFSAGFSLNFRHFFVDSAADLNFYWAHLRTSDTATFPVNRQPPPSQQMTGPNWDIGPDAGTTSSAKGQLQDNYDNFNAELGKDIHLMDKLNSRIFAGLSGVWLKQQTNASFSGTDPILGSYHFAINTASKYNAAGVRLGLDGEYHGYYNVNVVGLLAGAIYIGSQQPSTTTEGAGSILATAGIPVNHQSISHKSYIQAVPAVDAKLGLKYSRPYDKKLFSIEAGYQASVYINAMQNYVPSTYVPGSLGIVSGSVFLQSLLKTTESFSLDGPYITALLKM